MFLTGRAGAWNARTAAGSACGTLGRLPIDDDALVVSHVPAGQRPVPHVAVRFDLDRLRQLFVDVYGWARDVYG